MPTSESPSSAHNTGKGIGGAFLPVLTALGIVYGDIGTSPLYALREVFNGPHKIPLIPEHVYGVLSLITWSLILVVSIKYFRFVMRADNKGEGGVLALTALATMQKDKKVPWQKLFLSVGLFGAALLVGDSMITAAISVLSAVEGLSVANPQLETYVLPISFVILFNLFWFQKKGTATIGRFFGPIMVAWFILIGVLGIYSLIQTPEVLYSMSPHYALKFWISSPSISFLAMSSVFLVCTGGEALYADMGHLGLKPITNGWFYIALPGLLLNYFGQGALILRDPLSAVNPFYLLAPQWAQLPLVAIATAAAVIASQAIISGIFSLTNQAVQLGYSPRLNIIHTSSEARGQIYVPFINWLILLGTLWLVFEFKNSSSLAGAYGISVSLTMIVTTILTGVVAWHTWKWSFAKTMLIVGLFLIVDITFFSANALKFFDGGWVPVTIALVVFIVITTWKRGRVVLFDRLKKRSCPFSDLLQQIQKEKPVRVDGTAVFMVGDAETVPPALLHNLQHNKVLHKTVLFLTVVGEEVAYVAPVERVQISELGHGFHRVTGHYGFMESPNVLQLLKMAKLINNKILSENPTFFLGREILVAGQGTELSFWQKILFSVMAKNSASANSFFKLPFNQVIEVGMQIEL